MDWEQFVPGMGGDEERKAEVEESRQIAKVLRGMIENKAFIGGLCV